MKAFFIFSFLTLGFFISVHAQKAGTSYNEAFIDYQKTFPRPGDALKRKADTLQKQFIEKGLVWPAKYIYIRSFKYDSQLEVWVKNNREDTFQLFKTYKVCALAGTLGPKRMEGDYQVPEGFYYINEFNPNSSYHLSLGINYPNESDKILSDSFRPGGDIYIHGSCVTVGCIPVTDQQIEEIYILSAHAKNNGQDFIPVHIFPVRFNVKRSVDYMNALMFNNPGLKPFAKKLEDAFNYFERFKQLPVITTDEKGEYYVHGMKDVLKPKPVIKKAVVHHRYRNITDVAEVVHQWPVFAGGGEAFLKYLDKVGNKLATQLPPAVPKAHVQVEFIVDTDGVATNFNVVNGVNASFDDDMISLLEKMPVWQPAVLNGKSVAKKMKQSFTIKPADALSSQ
jgi:murein L,D-transpeptidase YafK